MVNKIDKLMYAKLQVVTIHERETTFVDWFWNVGFHSVFITHFERPSSPAIGHALLPQLARGNDCRQNDALAEHCS